MELLYIFDAEGRVVRDGSYSTNRGSGYAETISALFPDDSEVEAVTAELERPDRKHAIYLCAKQDSVTDDNGNVWQKWSFTPDGWPFEVAGLLRVSFVKILTRTDDVPEETITFADGSTMTTSSRRRVLDLARFPVGASATADELDKIADEKTLQEYLDGVLVDLNSYVEDIALDKFVTLDTIQEITATKWFRAPFSMRWWKAGQLQDVLRTVSALETDMSHTSDSSIPTTQAVADYVASATPSSAITKDEIDALWD